MQLFENYPKTEEGIELLLNNLAIFKAELLLKSIDNLNVEDRAKDEILKKVLEILNERSNKFII